MSQSITPDKIVLWIYEKDIKLLPNNVKLLTNDIFQISKIDRDIKSYKKLIPSLYEYPDDFIVTADDDSYYSRNWLQELIQNYNPYKKEILGHRGHEITVDNNNKILPYNKWKKTIKTNLSSKYIILNGLGGILYPPHSLHQDVFKEHIFMDACPTTDDIWFYFMARKNNYVCKKISKEFKTYTWREARKNSLYNINVKRNINDESISKIVRIFGSPF
jgi:hypothetical protein